MSKGMCKPEVIGAIADYIWSERDDLFKHIIEISDPDSLFAPKLNGEPCDRDDVYQRLWNMNAHALTIRYTDHAVTEMVGEYELYPAMPVKCDVKLAANMDFFIYQCTEGDIHKSWPYQEVLYAAAMLMAAIVRSSKEYQEAMWK